MCIIIQEQVVTHNKLLRFNMINRMKQCMWLVKKARRRLGRRIHLPEPQLLLMLLRLMWKSSELLKVTLVLTR